VILKLFHTDQPAYFLEKIQPTLERDEAANGLMLGVCQQLVDDQKTGRPSEYLAAPKMVGVEDVQGLTAAALMTPPYSLILYCEPVQKIASLKELYNYLGSFPIPGVIGKNHVVETFAGLWHDQHGESLKINRKGRIYQLTQVTPTPFNPGYMRLASELDFDLIVEWAREFDREALGGEEGSLVSERTMHRIQQKEIFLWEDGLVTAMAVRTRSTRHGAAIGYVYTPSALRGRGYASSLVSTLSQYLLNDGTSFCSLMTDLDNPVSNHIYQKIGYKPVCDIEEIYFQSEFMN
jgi:ribosomal protein S18 acetylase RimI-like enzyme